jgi:hypothetical protein
MASNICLGIIHRAVGPRRLAPIRGHWCIRRCDQCMGHQMYHVRVVLELKFPLLGVLQCRSILKKYLERLELTIHYSLS